MTLNRRFYILGEVFIECCSRSVFSSKSKGLREKPEERFSWPNHGDGACVVFDDNLGTRAHPCHE